MEYGLAYVPCLVSEILANVMEAEARKMLPIKESPLLLRLVTLSPPPYG